MKKLLIWVLIILGIAGATWGMAQLASAPQDQTTVTLAAEVSDSDWVQGDRNASVVLVEYSDLQCPACAAYSTLVDQLTEEFGDQIAFVYRHFPLPQHQQAELAAWAAEAAGKQERFWEMLELIFANQAEWENQNGAREKFVSYAELLNLDLGRFEADLDSPELKQKVESDYQSGVAIVSWTPTFFLNGIKLQSNPRSYEEFRGLILQELSR